ncbi:cbb3-type cytochrome c oxidase subunit II [Vibrio splendidus]|jgi:cytochrome c oxidase cbb3-type subunit 2|uniref:Cbb3-type cytochrome c oxidase subunit II n=1 Tax=Vibrio splendidus TaxID=29497 RepID=A0A1B9QNJ5_VIBSP|nr:MULTISPECIES: cbb3-type cytochrome c oxidase subunit II [Vibrio]EAP95973.1 Cbb3-type cytochrome oxidase, cytochrome c subunit [Vibrio splendidus 12B01]MBB1463771.1 cbb3-type cytochrome c oxidase subunit II [Vibrio sp. SG41-7]MBT9241452.1 cbb3-type cytochrome c oxidase subunit II [Vibrio splendidus]MCC4860584.1 cbb3-type cytochrome c oxidase subunit II [Vibrio splendidus]MCC5516850.1 cytochrome oxidase [Vibrio splendidus]
MMSKDFTHSIVILILTTVVVASFSLLVWVVPSIVRGDDIAKGSLAMPLTPIELAGRDIYISEGCHVCHTQMVRPLEPEVKRNGRPNKEADDIYEFPNLWGSKRTGPDLTNLGRKYSDQWHVIHLTDPRKVVPTSIMPSYPWLFEQTLTGDDISAKMEVLRTLGVPYTDQEIGDARLQVRGKTKGEALIRYLQSLGKDTSQEVSQ